MSDLFETIKSKRYAFMENIDELLKCQIFSPITGKYKIEFFCRRKSDAKTAGRTYRMVCAYVVHAQNPKNGLQPFPQDDHSEWGPGIDLETAGLRPRTHKEAIIEVENGETEVRFVAERDVGRHRTPSQEHDERRRPEWIRRPL